MKFSFSRSQLQSIVFSAYLLILFYKYFNAELLSKHTNPPIIYPVLNISYWLFIISDIKDIIFENYFIKLLIDISLFTFCILSAFKPKNNYYPLIFTLILWFYQFLYFSIVAYQPFTIGILFPCIPFIFNNNIKFSFIFHFGRYFLCGLYFLAGILKVVNGGLWNIHQMSNSIRISAADYMFYSPKSFKTALMSFCIEHFYLSYLLYLGAAVLEYTFLIGFFTKRCDLYLIGLFLLFHFSNFLILDLPFTNHSIILLFFLPIKDYFDKSHRNSYLTGITPCKT